MTKSLLTIGQDASSDSQPSWALLHRESSLYLPGNRTPATELVARLLATELSRLCWDGYLDAKERNGSNNAAVVLPNGGSTRKIRACGRWHRVVWYLPTRPQSVSSRKPVILLVVTNRSPDLISSFTTFALNQILSEWSIWDRSVARIAQIRSAYDYLARKY
jgi:hypothetical protein